MNRDLRPIFKSENRWMSQECPTDSELSQNRLALVVKDILLKEHILDVIYSVKFIIILLYIMIFYVWKA